MQRLLAVFELAACSKRRIHFHQFLREMNQRLVRHVGGDDRLESTSREWLADVELLCFDEFHVHDIADAFLIGRFLDIALKLGTRIVSTSNYAPAGLLPNPEFHARFLPTIELIERHFTVIQRVICRLKSRYSRGVRSMRSGGFIAASSTTWRP